MQFDFTDAMKKASDTELIKIVTTDRADYQDAALRAAEAELAVRNLHTSTIEIAKKHIEQVQKADAAKAAIPLEVHWKIFAFILPFVLLFLLSGIFKAEGYERKANELAKWAFIGFGFYVIMIIFIILEKSS
jgi:hypothetical protein